MKLGCSNCEYDDIEVGNCWNALGETFECPECHAILRCEGDYIGDDGGWGFWLQVESRPGEDNA